MVFDRSSVNKSHNVSLYIGPTKLDTCPYSDYLGIRLDSKLSFELHIDKVLNSCNARLCTLSKIRKYIDERTAVTIYKSIIMSKLQYGLVFTGNVTQKYQDRLQVIQNRALRICSLAKRYVSNISLHLHHVLPMMLRFRMDLLILMYKVVARNYVSVTDSRSITSSMS